MPALESNYAVRPVKKRIQANYSSYKPRATVWKTAIDAINSGSGTPIWKFLEMRRQEDPLFSMTNFIDLINNICLAGCTVSHSDEIASIRQKTIETVDGSRVIRLDFHPVFGGGTKTLFTAEVKGDGNIQIAFQDSVGQFFLRDIKVVEVP